MSDVLFSMCTLQWASEQKHVAMMIKTSRPTAVCSGTHFDSTIVYTSSSVHTALLLSQCNCQDKGMMQQQYTTTFYTIIRT